MLNSFSLELLCDEKNVCALCEDHYVPIIMWGFLPLRILGPSTTMLWYRMDTVIRSANGQGLSPQIIPISLSLWHLLCQFIFCCALRALRSRSDCTEDPTIVSFYIGSVEAPPFRVLGQEVYQGLRSPLLVRLFYTVPSSFPIVEVGRV